MADVRESVLMAHDEARKRPRLSRFFLDKLPGATVSEIVALLRNYNAEPPSLEKRMAEHPGMGPAVALTSVSGKEAIAAMWKEAIDAVNAKYGTKRKASAPAPIP
jgi:hypothetical protein